MDKKFDSMNPGGFSCFNGPIFSFNLLLWVWHGAWPQVEPILCSCSHFYSLEKLNVSMEYKFPKNASNLSQSGLSKLVADLLYNAVDIHVLLFTWSDMSMCCFSSQCSKLRC